MDCFFNNELFKQINGVAMGSPLDLLLLIFCLCYEQLWLKNCHCNFKPYMYRRYVDDTLVNFQDKSHALFFLNYINLQHSDISFTMETESNGNLPFLDLLVSKCNNKFLCSVFRKPTFSGLGNSFYSCCGRVFGINAVKTLIHRAFSLSSTYSLFHDEILFLKNYFVNNGYSDDLFSLKQPF